MRSRRCICSLGVFWRVLVGFLVFRCGQVVPCLSWLACGVFLDRSTVFGSGLVLRRGCFEVFFLLLSG